MSKVNDDVRTPETKQEVLSLVAWLLKNAKSL